MMGTVFSTNQVYQDNSSSEDEDYLPCSDSLKYPNMIDGKDYTSISSNTNRKISCVVILTDSTDHLNAYSDAVDCSNYTTDAIETGGASREPRIYQQACDHLITVAKVAEIENDLDFYEKVSLVYLLYDDAEIALQYLIQLQEGAHINVLVEWAQFCAKTDNWQGKLVEALCIIQNYEIVCKLGYNQNEVCERFLPLNENTSLFISLLKKKLYRICENFTKAHTIKFLQNVKKDVMENNLLFKNFDESYMEMYFLHWITIKYITPTDISNLYKALKVLEMYDVVDNLKLLANNSEQSSQRHKMPNSAEQSVKSRKNENINQYDYNLPEINFERSISSVSSATGSIQQDRIRKNSYEDKSYAVDPDSPGVCLIINQEDFYTEFEKSLQHLLPPTNKQLEKREGTNVDRDQLEYTFKKYGFTVIVVNNITHIQMKEEIKAAINLIKNHSSLIICILTHGIEGKVYGSNSIPVEVREIQNLMCKSNVVNLKRKPKILILQSCQGTECQQVVEDDEETEDLQTDGPGSAVPRMADMLVFWATVPGYGAVRDKKRGTWFIQSLCNAILENASKIHFEDICTLVKQEVIDKRWETKKSTRAMVPIKESTLSRFFFLPPMRSTKHECN